MSNWEDSKSFGEEKQRSHMKDWWSELLSSAATSSARRQQNSAFKMLKERDHQPRFAARLGGTQPYTCHAGWVMTPLLSLTELVIFKALTWDYRTQFVR